MKDEEKKSDGRRERETEREKKRHQIKPSIELLRTCIDIIYIKNRYIVTIF